MVALFYHSINVSILSPSFYQDPDWILLPVMWCQSHSIPNTAHQPLFILQQFKQFIIRGHHTGFLAEKRPFHTCVNDPITVQKSDLGLLLESGHHVPTVNCFYLVSRGRKSKVLFKYGKRMAEALMTSVGFGVTRPRTWCIRQTITYKHLQLCFWNSIYVPVSINVMNCPGQKQDVYVFLWQHVYNPVNT